MTAETVHGSTLKQLNVPRLVNAAGIYTDLGGSCLSPTIWEALGEINSSFASLIHLFDRCGEAISEITGAPAARIAPGASASIALMVASCIARGDGTVSERLPGGTDLANEVLLQVGHTYNYSRCAALGGGTLRTIGSDGQTTADELRDAIGPQTCAILFAAHLGAEPGTLALEEVVAIARPLGVPVIVDAAYMSYPLEWINSYTEKGADLACFSAKYFYGPNAGGFILGTPEAIAGVRLVDFTEYESGPFRNFGRALKMDRTTVVATTLALTEWYAMDHERRWADYATRVDHIRVALSDLAGVEGIPCNYALEDRIVMDRPVNALAMRSTDGSRALADVIATLAQGDPWVRCSDYDGALVVCVETVVPDEDDYLIQCLREAWQG